MPGPLAETKSYTLITYVSLITLSALENSIKDRFASYLHLSIGFSMQAQFVLRYVLAGRMLIIEPWGVKIITGIVNLDHYIDMVALQLIIKLTLLSFHRIFQRKYNKSTYLTNSLVCQISTHIVLSIIFICYM